MDTETQQPEDIRKDSKAATPPPSFWLPPPLQQPTQPVSQKHPTVPASGTQVQLPVRSITELTLRPKNVWEREGPEVEYDASAENSPEKPSSPVSAACESPDKRPTSPIDQTENAEFVPPLLEQLIKTGEYRPRGYDSDETAVGSSSGESRHFETQALGRFSSNCSDASTILNSVTPTFDFSDQSLSSEATDEGVFTRTDDPEYEQPNGYEYKQPALFNNSGYNGAFLRLTPYPPAIPVFAPLPSEEDAAGTRPTTTETNSGILPDGFSRLTPNPPINNPEEFPSLRDAAGMRQTRRERQGGVPPSNDPNRADSPLNPPNDEDKKDDEPQEGKPEPEEKKVIMLEKPPKSEPVYRGWFKDDGETCSWHTEGTDARVMRGLSNLEIDMTRGPWSREILGKPPC